MNIEDYKARRSSFAAPPHRNTCPRCWKAMATCFCAELKPFESPVPFVIVQHLDEARNPIATARMAHMSVTNSTLIIDKNFANNDVVDRLLADKSKRNLMLYPSPDALPIEQIFEESREPGAKPPVFWILDTTWSYVPKMLRTSPALRSVPMVKFTPEGGSRFQIRKQPHPNCMSTIESMYVVIERFLKHEGKLMTEHQALIDVFQYMVDQQIRYGRERNDQRHLLTKAARRSRRAQKNISPVP